MTDPWHSGGNTAAELPLSDPALMQLTQMAATGVPVPAALRAAAAEVAGSRSQRWLLRLADRLERGEQAADAADDGAPGFMAAMASGRGGVIGSLGDYLTVRHTLQEMQRRVLATMWGAALLIAVAAAIGITMQTLLSNPVMGLIDEFELELPAGMWLQMQVIWVALWVLLAIAAALALLLVLLRCGGAAGATAERIFGMLPLVGGAMSAIQLAEMCDSVARLLAAGQTYPRAFELAASSTRSARLRQWLGNAAASLRQGAAVDTVIVRLPTFAGVLPALVGPLGPAPGEPDQAWRIASRSAMRTAQRRTARCATLLPPLIAVSAAAIAWASLTSMIVGFTLVVDLIGALA